MNHIFFIGVGIVYAVFFALTSFEEFGCYLIEESVAEYVFFLFVVYAHFLTEAVKLRFDEVCGTAGDLLFVTDDLFYKFRLNGNRSFTVFAANESFELFGNVLVTAEKYVKYCLSTDDLRRRSYERREACIFSYAGNFLENFFEFILFACLFKLGNEVGEHSAGNLVEKSVNVNCENFGIEKTGSEIFFA